jgi:hypothetical protein
MIKQDMSVAGIQERMQQRIREELGNPKRKHIQISRKSGKSVTVLEQVVSYEMTVKRNEEFQGRIKSITEAAYMEILSAYHRAREELARLRDMGYLGHIACITDSERGLKRFEVVIDQIPEEMRRIWEEVTAGGK